MGMLRTKWCFLAEASGDGQMGGSGYSDVSEAGTMEPLLGGEASEGLDFEVADAKEAALTQKADVPERYELSVPEGFEGIDEVLLNDFTPLAHEAGISNVQAQKLADLYSRQMMAQAEVQEQQWFAQREAWVKELKSDPEFGNGNEQMFRGNVGKAQLALTQFGTPELRQYLLDTGLGDNVHVLKLMAKVGNALGEDSLVVGGSGRAGKRAADILFDGK